MDFCRLGIYRKNLLFIPKNMGILSDFSLILGIADQFLSLYTQNTGKSGVLVGIQLQFLCYMPNLRCFNNL